MQELHLKKPGLKNGYWLARILAAKALTSIVGVGIVHHGQQENGDAYAFSVQDLIMPVGLAPQCPPFR
jgi:hypothetical protein